MKNAVLSEINIYPVKSLGGISLQSSMVEIRGLRFDRRWMLIDENNIFISQRKFPKLALFNVMVHQNELRIFHKTGDYEELSIPIDDSDSTQIEVTIWNDKVNAYLVGNSADCWFSGILKIPCRLVYLPDASIRKVDPGISIGNDIISFADAYPFLIIGQASLDELNRRLKIPVPMNRFRPNFVFKEGEPFEEDNWKKFKIGPVIFYNIKPCARCIITTIDQNTGEKSLEPLQTLTSFRRNGNKVLFGRNLLHEGEGQISTGDKIEVLEWR